uniref:Uncharacterized protein n=1 Tax=Chromera velia CCMP2878 TaxID=1169474 RepID=A0A0G4G116_9ALVE|mmetsp:Transcript_14883/g.30072  ORF Transcript_14883/g.30072 Transcript_14883/m.30072 type:complete len:329 (-) Transcript_14883:523-1509(-)|eukprot:Cvel_19718.t1-p1 / transcript=Cvel_19718.t1 / gene=Cvel_19718 / organism=Chromera_velia_CCMP2878 / gene_product=Very-long-chain 3-oxoacyl-CoA reductase 1, putative / transcript_product=Very-long-chain 3-oxoacyl-CoA reductase 1, putative / location=Cvel_scaffold1722:20117-24523(-) / protein_length=328 / sequence_SO=supercontig / SO=protein_coding / is_pseudo=false
MSALSVLLLHAKYACTAIGAVWLGIKLLSAFFSSLVAASTPKRNLKKLGEWAVVTGATDGIGKAIAACLAKKQMSVLLVARNKQRLDETAKELKGLTKGLVKTVDVDFSKSAEEVYAKLGGALKDLEVGVLVNNVGLSYPHAKFYYELDSQYVDDLIELNVRSVLRTTHLVYKGMCDRKKGAILSISSAAAVLPSDPLYCAYSGTKAAAEAFSRSLAEECRGKNVLVQCQVPLLVTSKLSKVKRSSIFCPDPATYAKAALDCLERGDTQSTVVSPYFWHTAQYWLVSLMPVKLWHYIRLGQTLDIRKRALKKAEREAAEGGEKSKKGE